MNADRQVVGAGRPLVSTAHAFATSIGAAQHPAQQLWAEHAYPGDQPLGVLPVPEAIRGTAFFPGGYGLFVSEPGGELPSFPFGGVMVLGHDFHSEIGYRRSLAQDCESLSQPTWRNLLRLLAQAAIPTADCFFTNFFMGLRQGTITTGVFPGSKSEPYVEYCRRFLLRQLEVQRPRLVLTLGVRVPYLVAPMSPELAPWQMRQGLKHLDACGPIQLKVSFAGLPGFRTTVVALTHPSLRHTSVRHRRFHGATGAEAELKMLIAARAMANQLTEDGMSVNGNLRPCS